MQIRAANERIRVSDERIRALRWPGWCITGGTNKGIMKCMGEARCEAIQIYPEIKRRSPSF